MRGPIVAAVDAGRLNGLGEPSGSSSFRVGYRRSVPSEASPGRDRVRTAEVAATLCLATDLGMGFPFEQGLHSTLVAMRLADRLGVDHATASQTLLRMPADVLRMHDGHRSHHCDLRRLHDGAPRSGDLRVSTRDPGRSPARAPDAGELCARTRDPDRPPASEGAEGEDPHLAAICEVAEMLAERLALPPRSTGLFVHLTDRWDGKGPPAARRRRRSRSRSGSCTWLATPRSSACWAARNSPFASYVSARATASTRRSRPASRTALPRSSRSSTIRLPGKGRWPASRIPA